jgi:1-acyl-sn-glycerol-3-phosphate acyltransferase
VRAFVSQVLTELGLPRLWGDDPERLWPFVRRWLRYVMRVICPSYGYGVERMPVSGGAVVAANHFAAVDPPLIGLYSTRTIYYMAKVELLQMPVVGELLRYTGAFAVRRGEGDRDAVRLARWLTREGHVVGMFMEGTRQQSGHPGQVHPGAAMIAMQEGVPIVPCGIDTFGWSMRTRRRCCVVWGEPLSLEHLSRTGKGYREGAALVEEELGRLWRAATAAAAEGYPPRLPDGARRSAMLTVAESRPRRGLHPWPAEQWAEGPLGPLYRPGRFTPDAA